MRRTARLLASVKPARYLEANTPTGLTGLLTHPAPRSTLIYLYSSTLDKLAALPEESIYRQSTAALTQRRLAIVEAAVPAGYAEWSTRAQKTLAEHPEVFNTPEGAVAHDEDRHVKSVVGGKTFVTTRVGAARDPLSEEWDGEKDLGPELEGTRTLAERLGQVSITAKRPGSDKKTVEWEPEPQLDADQISEIENKIGAGLIEEVIQVAEGELNLVDVMAKAQVWSDLEEKPVEGQWAYFTRDTGTATTQPPPQKV
ncbi:MAG: hypothetical protein M1818_006231 [Claussenomyces sp. TS43310]|nr:MAG: hypothetical protein M1818_006231 [Claussenomyces sp. TS43310]